MVRGSYCQQVMRFFSSFFFGLQLTARLKLQFKSGTPLFKSLDPPLYRWKESGKKPLTNEIASSTLQLLLGHSPQLSHWR